MVLRETKKGSCSVHIQDLQKIMSQMVIQLPRFCATLKHTDVHLKVNSPMTH